MSWITRFFGQNEADASNLRGQILSEADIVECIDAHMKWKGRLQGYLNGTSHEQLNPAEISCEDQCALGKWIHGTAPDYFQTDESFLKLCSDHAYFHMIAGSVVRKVQENNREEAESLLKNEYACASREVIQDLTELVKLLHREA